MGSDDQLAQTGGNVRYPDEHIHRRAARTAFNRLYTGCTISSANWTTTSRRVKHKLSRPQYSGNFSSALLLYKIIQIYISHILSGVDCRHWIWRVGKTVSIAAVVRRQRLRVLNWILSDAVVWCLGDLLFFAKTRHKHRWRVRHSTQATYKWWSKSIVR